MTGLWLGASALGREDSHEYRVLRVDAEDDVLSMYTSDDLLDACLFAERWLERWAEEYPDDILWLEERTITAWSTAAETVGSLVPTW